jgi:hypothetical protein
MLWQNIPFNLFYFHFGKILHPKQNAMQNRPSTITYINTFQPFDCIARMPNLVIENIYISTSIININ